MLLLSLDTSTSQGGVAVLRDEKVLSSRIWNRERSHSELLTPSIQDCLHEAGAEARDLTAIAVGHGPGSFTGIRVGINAAKTLAFTLNLPVFTFDTTEILASAVDRTDLPVLTLVNAQKNSVFASVFSPSPENDRVWPEGVILRARTSPLQTISIDELETRITSPHLCVGDAFDEYASVFGPDLLPRLVRDEKQSDFPRPEVLGRMAWAAHRDPSLRTPLVWKDVQALYIRASGAEEKLREGQGKSS